MKLKILKWGNSIAIRLRRAVLIKTGLSIGVTVPNHAVRSALILGVSKPKYSLADLVAQCDPSVPLTADMKAWDQMQPVGLEKI